MAKAIVGLGNPGAGYERTRHNAGWLLTDYLATRWQMGAFRRSGLSVAVTGTLQGVPVRLLKPTTFMNLSGQALKHLATTGFDPAADLLVLVDDVAFEPGQFRLKGAGSAGGHNGLKSIEGTLRRQDYARLRIGVGAKPAGWDLADWVLGKLTEDDRSAIDASLERMAEAVECWLQEGIERAMSRFNRQA